MMDLHFSNAEIQPGLLRVKDKGLQRNYNQAESGFLYLIVKVIQNECYTMYQLKVSGCILVSDTTYQIDT